jgi:hypothetical protein
MVVYGALSINFDINELEQKRIVLEYIKNKYDISETSRIEGLELTDVIVSPRGQRERIVIRCANEFDKSLIDIVTLLNRE